MLEVEGFVCMQNGTHTMERIALMVCVISYSNMISFISDSWQIHRRDKSFLFILLTQNLHLHLPILHPAETEMGDTPAATG